MRVETWNCLTTEERNILQMLAPAFIAAVKSSKAIDGADFASKFRVAKEDDMYLVTDGRIVLGEIRHHSKAVIEALFEDATLNYGR